MSKLTARELRKYLEGRPHAELIDDIVTFFGRFDGVKEYYSTQTGHGYDDELLEKYKAIIRKEFRVSRSGSMPKLSVARKAINDYKKISRNLLGLVDLMLFYVEMGVAFTNAFGDIDEPFYSSLEGVYAGALKIISANSLAEQFRARCRKIVTDTRHMGWGFHDILSQAFDETFGE